MAGAPGWHVIRRTAPVPSGDPMQWSHSFRLAAIAVTVGLVPLLFVLSMVRAQWSEAPAGQTAVGPMPPLVISPVPASAPSPTPAPNSPNEELSRPQDTVVTAMLQTKPDPLLPDEPALLPVEPIEALQRSTAELEIRPEPVGLSAAPLPLTIVWLTVSRAGTPQRALATRSIVAAGGGRSGEPALGGQDPSSQRGVDVTWSLSSCRALSKTLDLGNGRLAVPRGGIRIEPVQPGRSSTQVTDDPANLARRPRSRWPASYYGRGRPSAAGGRNSRFHSSRRGSTRRRVGPAAGRLFARPGFTVADIRSVDFSIGKPSVWYFFARDRAASQRLVEELGRFSPGGASLGPDHASDFTHFVPKPRPGSVEVWLPGS